MSAPYDPQEQQYYDRLFAVIDKQDSGVIPGQDALPFLVSSNLSQQTLGEIWALADPDNNGFLTKDGWYKAARLIGWMQKGNHATVEESLMSKAGPYPTFVGQPAPPSHPPQGPASSSLPPLTPADRTKFTRIFVGCGPQNGLVSGDKAQAVFVKSQLSYEKLGQIWTLADTQQRGALDLTDFIIGMYLIQSCMANPSLPLPQTLPPDTYSQASGGRPPPVAPVTPQRTGSSLRGPVSPVQPQRTGTPPRAPIPRWDVTSEAKATSDRFFAQLDPQNKGLIEGDVAVPFMLQSQLDEGTLASIWDLADIRHEGKLDRDQFAVAMHLINTKLAGQDIPTVLPISLIPPSLRDIAGKQEVLTAPSSATKDLFDLFDDPPVSSPVPAPSLPLPPSRRSTGAYVDRPIPSASPISAPPVVRSPPPPISAAPTGNLPGDDLLGDDATPVPAASASYGNIQNQLSNTTRSLTDLTKTREELQGTADSSADQLADLESKLSAARVKHEAETKAVADLRTRVTEQTSRVKQLQADVIAAESDVSALRSEKGELEQVLLRDKEEVRGLQKRMKEVEEEKSTLKTLLEKLRKDARQQKGMVTIAKKQLSTAESSRDVVQSDIDTQASAPAATAPASVPLPTTPQALSPVPTGVSQRSNNPFERLRDASVESPKPAPQSSNPTNFDDAFADFVPPSDAAAPHVDSEVPPSAKEIEPEQPPVVQDEVTAIDASETTHAETAGPVEIDDHLQTPKGEDFTPLPEPALSSTAVPIDAAPHSGETLAPEKLERPASPASSDENEGPEDLDTPAHIYNKPALAEPVSTGAPARRSAPPPPSRDQSFDPFGAPEPSAVPKASGPAAADFDEDDFDFSDLPPAQINAVSAPPSKPETFDDEFAGFDDEFGSSQVNTGSDVSNSMSKSYEMVSPQAPKPHDEWGFGQSPVAAQPIPQSALSFDDAFGGDFEPPSAPPATDNHIASASTPQTQPVPERRESQPQNDDIEDVKKLCAMGFSRSLVVEALDANGYDFQKTLNVLLSQ